MNFIIFIYLCNVILLVWWNYIAYFGDLSLDRFYSKLLRGLFTSLFLEIAIIHIAYLLLRSKTKYFLWLFSIFSIIDLVVEGFLLYTHKTMFNALVADALLQTDLLESYEFLLTYLDYKILLAVVCLCLIFSYFFKIFQAKESKELLHRKKKNFYALYSIIAAVFILDIFNKHYIKKDLEAFSRLREHSLTRIVHSFAQLHNQQNLFGSYKEYLANYEEIYKQYLDKVKTTNGVPNIVLIIGESAQRNHLSLYGNALETTPKMQKLEETGNLIKFSDVIAPYAQTRFVLDYLLNFASIGEDKFYQRLNVVDLFKLGGYKTFYFSNQELASINTRLISAVANRADVTRFVDPYANHDLLLNKAYDEGLLPFIIDASGGGQKFSSFMIVHLMGSHFSYKYRYPQEFNHFNADDITMPPEVTKEMRQVVAEYENSIFYTDSILERIFHAFKDKNALIIYLSDHGESLYEHNGFLGHFVTSRFVAEIPFFIMVTDTFKSENPKLYNVIIKAKDKPYMTDDLIHTLSHLGGIEVEDYRKEKDILSDDFDYHRKRIFKNEKDYEILRSEKAKLQ
ncbi:phosphoethanolamine transferase [Helicobacter sp. MIT 11-5569]|uniref:phosphoethanolamine transferase n=1 Tax=Helicobacter sp. MIT 11-5569 TaxID=1548151 RepID=UPI000B0AEC43|nr:phosphoethanolamine transferase [Helicobacter sp. MIT 11-5569]